MSRAKLSSVIIFFNQTTRIKSVIREFYGENAKESKDYTRIINERHTNRLAGLMEGEKVISGGEVDVSDCYISPTLLDNPRMDSKVMSDEVNTFLLGVPHASPHSTDSLFLDIWPPSSHH